MSSKKNKDYFSADKYINIMLGFLLSITIMSYNLRNAQADDGLNSWQYRKEACVAAVIDQRPDVVGFQENSLPQDTFLSGALSMYDHVAVGREEGNPVTETNAIYYLRDRFRLVKTNTFWLSETPNVCSKGWDGKYARVATYTLLEDVNTGEQYLIMNTHLDHKGVNARRESMRLVSDTINSFSTEKKPVFSILMGDLNVKPLDPALEPVRQHMLSTQEVFKNQESTFHGWGEEPNGGKIIDYIFYKNAWPTSFRVLNDNSYGVAYLSDHYPIIATFAEANEGAELDKAYKARMQLEIRTTDWNKFYRYADKNDSIRKLMAANKKYKNTVVFYGNSITDRWYRHHPNFFKENGFIGRGIGGQTSSHLLTRFREDVLDLKPKYVMLMIGTNDLAQNNGPITQKHIMDNIASMCELAKLHGVRPILCSVLPARRFGWTRMVVNSSERIISLNKAIQEYAKANKIQYVDYYSAMVDTDGGLKEGLHKDEVHPISEGYDVMEPIALEALRKAHAIK